jgi:ribosomal-protein-alanine N-acetyltransferase
MLWHHSAVPSLLPPVLAAGQLRDAGQPTLRADGLSVRPWHRADAEVVLNAYRDPGIQRWHLRTMADLAEAQALIESWAERWREEEGANWAVVDGDLIVGRIGLTKLELYTGHADIAYWVLPSARGRQVAPRALAALTEWAFEQAGFHRLELLHSTQNPASCRVASKAGFAQEGTLSRHGRHLDGWHDMHLHAKVAP